VESFLKQIQDELVNHTYQPMPVRKKEIPKDGGTKVRVLSIPAIRDRVVQGALKLILEPILKPISNRDRTATVRNDQPEKRFFGWTKRLCRGRHVSSILTCGLTSVRQAKPGALRPAKNLTRSRLMQELQTKFRSDLRCREDCGS
jgi:hypothetical protein